MKNNDMTSTNLLVKAMQDFFSKPPEEVFPVTDSSIDKSLDFALSLSQYLAALNAVDRTKVIKLMEFILNNPLPAALKKSIILQPPSEKRKKPLKSRSAKDSKKKKKPKKKKKVAAKVAGYVNYENIEGTDHNIVFRLDHDHIMDVRKGKFTYKRDPKIEVRENKAFEYRESHSSYCGERKTLKNWLYFV